MGRPRRGSTLSGSEAPFWLLCLPSSRCGSVSRSTTSPVLPSSTGSASKLKQKAKPPPDQSLEKQAQVQIRKEKENYKNDKIKLFFKFYIKKLFLLDKFILFLRTLTLE